MARQMLMDNVYLTYIPSEKFKTSFFSAQLVMPLQKETAGLNALLVNVLSRGTLRFPDMRSLSAQLDRLYGARLEPTVRKRGRTRSLALWPAAWMSDSFPMASGCWSPWRICWGSCF